MRKKFTLSVDGNELTKADIKMRYDKYNKMYFDGKLGKCKFLWLSPNEGVYGHYVAQPTKKGLESKIGVARNTYWTEENLRKLLVHEMIHMYIRTVEGKIIDGLLGHGRRFRAHCKRLKKDYGLNIRILDDFGYKNKKLYPKQWEKVLMWLIDR